MTEERPSAAPVVAPLPEPLLAHLASVIPEDRLQQALALRGGARRITLRVNTLRATREQLQRALNSAGIVTRVVDWLPDALVVESGTVPAIQATPEFAAGHIHIQNLSSIAVAHALAPQGGPPSPRVLDACAAPGSKASHVGALIGSSAVDPQFHGRLVAADSSRARVFRMNALLEHLGVRAETLVEHAERWGRRSPEMFDFILLDAPCSAEGRALAGDDAAAADWSLRKCRTLASRQKAMLHSAIEACAPGGVIVYSTCTLGAEENELVLVRALELYAGRIALEPIPVALPMALPAAHGALPAAVHARRIVPCSESTHPDGPWLEGFFIARLHKL